MSPFVMCSHAWNALNAALPLSCTLLFGILPVLSVREGDGCSVERHAPKTRSYMWQHAEARTTLHQHSQSALELA